MKSPIMVVITIVGALLCGGLVLQKSIRDGDRAAARQELDAKGECLRMGGQVLLTYNFYRREFHVTGCKVGG